MAILSLRTGRVSRNICLLTNTLRMERREYAEHLGRKWELEASPPPQYARGRGVLVDNMLNTRYICIMVEKPLFNENIPPYYAWFIKRGPHGERTHHIHMVEAHFEHWDRLYFRDWLRTHPEDANAYGELKMRLAKDHPNDRIAYTEAKGAFIKKITARAKLWYTCYFKPTHLWDDNA